MWSNYWSWWRRGRRGARCSPTTRRRGSNKAQQLVDGALVVCIPGVGGRHVQRCAKEFKGAALPRERFRLEREMATWTT